MESEDSGLADVLEPSSDFDDDDENAVTSLRLVGAAGAASIRGGSLRSHVAAPVQSVRSLRSVRTSVPLPIQDFAFADTVFARELEDAEAPPPSGGLYYSDSMGNAQHGTPLPFALPAASDNVDVPTRARIAFAHLRHSVRGSIEEMRELWAGTAEIVADEGANQPAPSPFAFFVRRVLALWSCFQWSRADLTRAAMIGGAVFAIAATIGAVTVDFGADFGGSSTASGASAASSGVRKAHTLDQHTGLKPAHHTKR
jgi:hypothetical protein